MMIGFFYPFLFLPLYRVFLPFFTYPCLLQVENLVTQDDRGDMSIILCLPSLLFCFSPLIPTTHLLFTTFVLLMLHFLCRSDSRHWSSSCSCTSGV
ncbi:hypothetical protein ASPBRDRAFT_345542 [Aspergillus brasiliensis CBS 101740]|uniref:Uncharacterized protein n=1 Tax=Aspergillus brasiliensis (strain CBS 101740 / IMI 381727 / IBT 21946) TaxID=767769 RepID=A0A1L9U730_ASPBC|nr:hypothetical protein ASPBRDRAFT_345542 [Aspergillus brasiliensis CBS 101740]